MAAQHKQSGSRFKPLWRIRRPLLSVLLSCLLATTLLWAAMLAPRTFEATGRWSANTDPLLAQIDDPALHQLAAEVLHQRAADTPHVQLAPLTNSVVGLRVTATALSAGAAIDRVDEWLAHRAAQLTAQLQQQLETLLDGHTATVRQDEAQLAELEKQISTAQSRITDNTLPTHEALARKLADAQQQLEQLTAQQAVYMGANRTLKGLLSRRELLKQDLAMHQQRYGRSDDDPSVKLVKDQLEKLNVRIKVISEASKLDDQADAKLAAVSQQIETCKASITLMRAQQQQLIEQSQAATLMGELEPRRQALLNTLGYHRQQIKLIDEALAGHLSWGEIQQATLSQTRVIWPTPGHVLIMAILGGLLCWIVLQLVFRMADRTLDHAMLLEECLSLPILGQVSLGRPQLHWTSQLCRLTVLPLAGVGLALILCVSMAAVYLHLQAPQHSTNVWQMLQSPVKFGRLFDPSSQRPAVSSRALPVVIQLPDHKAQQLSDKSS